MFKWVIFYKQTLHLEIMSKKLCASCDYDVYSAIFVLEEEMEGGKEGAQPLEEAIDARFDKECSIMKQLGCTSPKTLISI